MSFGGRLLQALTPRLCSASAKKPQLRGNRPPQRARRDHIVPYLPCSLVVVALATGCPDWRVQTHDFSAHMTAIDASLDIKVSLPCQGLTGTVASTIGCQTVTRFSFKLTRPYIGEELNTLTELSIFVYANPPPYAFKQIGTGQNGGSLIARASACQMLPG